MSISRVISLIVIFFRRHGRGRAFWQLAVCAVLVPTFTSPLLAANTIVRMEIASGAGTPLGIIDIELYDDQAPKTVTNFLRYAGRGSYNNTIIHRSALVDIKDYSGPRFALQGGGHAYDADPSTGQPYFFKIPTDPPIQNEFSPSRPNTRGTITMAKTSNPNSATSEWFFNLIDNPHLDNPLMSGGFTVFGKIISGMDVVDTIAALPVFDGANNYPFYLRCNPYLFFGCTNPEYFLELPTIDYDPTSYIDGDSTTYLKVSNLIFVTRTPNVASTRTDLGTILTYTADVDMVFSLVGTATTDFAKKILASFSSPQNQSVHFNNGIHTMTMNGVMGSAGRVVTLYDGATARPNRYYAYGKTPDNQTDHWYDFTFDGETGAEISGDKIMLHFVDGKRGDEDLTANNSITHTGAQAVVTTTSTDSGAAQPGGCSITTTPSGMSRSGDWIVVSMFLALLALVRRRTRRNRI